MADYKIDFKLVKTMAEAFHEEAEDCEKSQSLVNQATGEVKNARELIYKDHLWRLTNKIGKLYFYVSGSTDFEPLLKEELQSIGKESLKGEQEQESTLSQA